MKKTLLILNFSISQKNIFNPVKKSATVNSNTSTWLTDITKEQVWTLPDHRLEKDSLSHKAPNLDAVLFHQFSDPFFGWFHLHLLYFAFIYQLYAHSDLNKRFLPRAKTTTAWKLIPHRSKISKNWNPPHWVPLHRFFKNWFLLIQKQLYNNNIQAHFTK